MDRPKPFSMIREFHLADWFTLGNACAGMGALFAVMTSCKPASGCICSTPAR
jgi:CDP-diacylglycerol--serine O-phosphatidyltransferase